MPDQQRERTPEERARAAAERAARRDGRPASPDAPAPAPSPPPPQPSAPRPRKPPPRKPPPRPRAPRRPLPPAARGAHFHRRRWFAVGVIVLLALVVIGYLKTFQPFHDKGHGSVAVTVVPGSDVGDIGKLLERRGVISGTTFFSLNATLTGRRSKLKPGSYTLAQDMSYGDALDALVEGPKAKVVKTSKLTIPEGRAVSEAAGLISKDGLKGDYAKAANAPAAIKQARKLGLPKSKHTTEGFLFPATYDLVEGSDAKDLVAKQLDAFAANFRSVDTRYAKRKNLTRYDIVTIASMVEREAQLDKERPLIAAVIYNRLHEGMPLSIDATIRYADDNWTRPLRQSELTRPGPYNTRLHRGLPPTPIGNPGLASLKAAANPAHVRYLYYVVKPGTCGQHSFSSTDRQFERDVARYNAAREQAGGKSPTKC